MASRTQSPSVSAASLLSHRATPDDLSLAQKVKQGLVTTACEEGDLAALVDLATSTHGLVSDSLRRTAWPLLLGCARTDTDAAGEKMPWTELPPHRDEAQVALDVNRAFVYYPTHSKHPCYQLRKYVNNIALNSYRLREGARSPET